MRPAVWVLLPLLAACQGEGTTAAPWPEASPERGRTAILAHGCTACHAIPGIPAAQGSVGPPLVHLSRQSYLAGVLPNTPGNLVRWLLDPQAVAPDTGMPDLNLSEQEAQDIAAYLYSVDQGG